MGDNKGNADFSQNQIDSSKFTGGYSTWKLQPGGPDVTPADQSAAGPFTLPNVTSIVCSGGQGQQDTYKIDGDKNIAFTKSDKLIMTGMEKPSCKQLTLTQESQRTKRR